MIEANAPAKIILLGEHAVVYNQPAIAIPVTHLRARVSITKGHPDNGLEIFASNLDGTILINDNITAQENSLAVTVQLILAKLASSTPDLVLTVESDIPLASGLGSGAAISTAIARGLAKALDIPLEISELNDLVYETEKLYHGIPSGVDNTVIVYERPIFFVRGGGIDFLAVRNSFHFLIADSGISAPTRDAVGDVNRLYRAEEERYSAIFNSIGKLVIEARNALETGNRQQLGLLMNQNQLYLEQLTVSCPKIDQLILAAREAGALGAKLSGGGRGGNIIALVVKDRIPAVRNALTEAGAAHVFETVLS